MSMREERSGKRHKGGEKRDLDHSELHSPTVQEIAEFLNVEMSPRTKMGLQGMPAAASAAAAAQAAGATPESTKHVVESQTGQDSIDDGYRWASHLFACLPCSRHCCTAKRAVLLGEWQNNRLLPQLLRFRKDTCPP